MPADLHFGLHLPTSGVFADVRLLVALARDAEAAGWDGFFIYDQVAADPPEDLADPVVVLSTLALNTERLRLGALVTPLPRRRPAKVARELLTLDRLSGGRMVLGVGTGGGVAEFDDLGEAADARVRAAQLDEALTVIAGLWSGAPFDFAGAQHTARGQFLPTPLQRPRIPIWVGGIWPNRPPFERAARWDGVFPHFKGGMLPPDVLRELVGFVDAGHRSDAPFDVIVRNKTGRPGGRALVADYAAAGLTWWLEGVESAPNIEALWSLIRRGPPRSRES